MFRRPLRYVAAAAVAAILAAAAFAMLAARTSVGFDAGGLAWLRHGSTELLGDGRLQVHSVAFATGRGDDLTAGDVDGSTVVDAAAAQIARRFAWGEVIATYKAAGNRLNIRVTVVNTTDRVLRALSIEPLSLHLPSPPREYDGITPMMAYDPGQPSLVSLHYTGGTAAVVNEQVPQPLLVGFPWATDAAVRRVFPLRMTMGRDGGYPPLYPPATRTVAPRSREDFTISLRFSEDDDADESLVADAYERFAAAFASKLEWADRRPIGQLILATTAAGWHGNPRGWLLDATMDTQTAEGREAFRTAVMGWADRSVDHLKALDAQGMIVWDIEGQEFRQPTTYLCDPRVLPQVAPEMDAIADDFFRKFRDAGLRVGVCVRPQGLDVHRQPPEQREVPDQARQLIEKIAYAKRRWGATLFYVDSNGDPNLPIDARVFEKVVTAFPDILLVPEHENLRYYAYAAPYRELRQGQSATPPLARFVYPRAFSVTYVADGDLEAHQEDLRKAVARGDVLLTRGWFDDPANAAVKKIYASTRYSAAGAKHDEANGVRRSR